MYNEISYLGDKMWEKAFRKGFVENDNSFNLDYFDEDICKIETWFSSFHWFSNEIGTTNQYALFDCKRLDFL